MKQLYMCTRDLQGGSFGVGRIATASEWKQIAREWCYQDDSEELSSELWHIKEEQKIIDFIQEIWELEIIKISKFSANLIKLINKKENEISYKLDDDNIDNKTVQYLHGKLYAYADIIDLILDNQNVLGGNILCKN